MTEQQYSGGPQYWAPPPYQQVTYPQPARRSPFGLGVEQLLHSLRVAAGALLPVLAVLTVSVAVVALNIGSSALEFDGESSAPNTGSLADWLRSGIVLLALSLGGRLTFSGGASADDGTFQLTTGLRLAPLLVTLVVLGIVLLRSRRDERRAPSPGWPARAARALLTGVLAGLVVLVLTLAGRTSSVFGLDVTQQLELDSGNVSLGAGPLGSWLFSTLLIGLAALGGRAAATPRRRTGQLAAVLGVLRTGAIGLLLASLAAGVLSTIYQLATADTSVGSSGGSGDTLAGVGAIGLFSVNGVIVLALVGLGVPLAANLRGTGNQDLLSEFASEVTGGRTGVTWSIVDEPLVLLGLFIAVVVLLLAAVRWTLRHPPAHLPPAAVGLGAAVGAVAGPAAAWVSRVTGYGDFHGTSSSTGVLTASVSGDAGPSLLWAMLLGAGWAAVAVLLARLAPGIARSLSPGLVRAIGGPAAQVPPAPVPAQSWPQPGWPGEQSAWPPQQQPGWPQQQGWPQQGWPQQGWPQQGWPQQQQGPQQQGPPQQVWAQPPSW